MADKIPQEAIDEFAATLDAEAEEWLADLIERLRGAEE